jgi:hypothetical protein
MTAWTPADLTALGDADEIDVTSERADGTPRPWVTIWIVRLDDELYIRSAHGTDNGWFRRAKASGLGRVRAGSLEREVAFVDAAGAHAAALHAAYHAKYDQYGPRVVGPVVSGESAQATLLVVPREAG